ncbi:TerB family tellurite resistance protein [Reinekea forsetii]|nr:TerB family tellurite resistance protein [Reinekea forsetii]
MTMFTDILLLLEKTEPVDQVKSEAIIAIMTLLYQVDGKFRIQEQEAFDRVMEDLPWHDKGVSKEAFHRSQITKSLNALEQNSIADYLQEFVPALRSDGKVLALFRNLANADGDLHPKEAEIIRQVATMMV